MVVGKTVEQGEEGVFAAGYKCDDLEGRGGRHIGCGDVGDKKLGEA